MYLYLLAYQSVCSSGNYQSSSGVRAMGGIPPPPPAQRRKRISVFQRALVGELIFSCILHT